MGPEYLVLAALVGGIVSSAALFGSGYFVRGRVADAELELLRTRIADLEGAIERTQRAQSLLGAADARRAAHDAGADPLGVGLLLADPGPDDDRPGPAAEPGDDPAARA